MEEDQALQSLARLSSIEQKVKQVQDTLDTRLPSRREHLAALLAGIKWRLQTQRSTEGCDDEAVQAAAKRVRMELGAFDYQTKEQAELLTRYLIELDDILSFGNAQVKDARKALVVRTQDLFAPADAMKTKSAKLKALGERVLESYLPPLSPVGGTPTVTAPIDEMKDVGGEEEEEKDDNDEEEEEQQSEAAEALQATTQSVNGDSKDQDMDGEDSSDEEDDAMDEEQEQGKQEEQTPATADMSSLPVWRPYYQLQRRPDGVYLLAKLHDTDARSIRVQWSEPSGALRISGFKLPTQKDLAVSRFSGTPTFGRFEILERFPRHVLNMDQATQQLHGDGTLEIRMPYYYAQSPARVQRAWYRPRDCFVW